MIGILKLPADFLTTNKSSGIKHTGAGGLTRFILYIIGMTIYLFSLSWPFRKPQNILLQCTVDTLTGQPVSRPIYHIDLVLSFFFFPGFFWS